MSRNRADKTKLLEYQRVYPSHYFVQGVYSAILGIFEGAYGLSVVTSAAKLHVLGISFFLTMFGALYTANLAAILTEEVSVTPVESFEDAVREGYRFCIERQRFNVLTSHYPSLAKDLFVFDPFDLKPGFVDGGGGANQATTTEQAFNQVNPTKATEEDEDPDIKPQDRKYCHAALADANDLLTFQAEGRYCELAVVGGLVVTEPLGFPIYQGENNDVLPWLYSELFDGRLYKELEASEPKSVCQFYQDDSASLSIQHFSGVWVVAFGFMLLGVVHTLFFKPIGIWSRRRRDPTLYTRIYSFDQHRNWIRVYVDKDDDESDDGSVNKSDDDIGPMRQKSTLSLSSSSSFRDNGKFQSFKSEVDATISTAPMPPSYGRVASSMAVMIQEEEDDSDGNASEDHVTQQSQASRRPSSGMDVMPNATRRPSFGLEITPQATRRPSGGLEVTPIPMPARRSPWRVMM